jgi:hypothetical protein
VCLQRKITTLITKRLKMPQKATLFSNIRKAPQIPLSNIILLCFLMPFLNVKSMLMLDCLNRLARIKRLFAPSLWKRKRVCSDSTIQWISRWVKPKEAQQFLLSLLPVFCRRNLLLHPLLPGVPAQRIVIIDGSCMGNHWVLACTLVGTDTLRYPVVIESLPGRGHELSYTNKLIPRLHSLLGSATP